MSDTWRLVVAIAILAINTMLSRRAVLRLVRSDFPSRYDDSSYEKRSSLHGDDWILVIGSILITPMTFPLYLVFEVVDATRGNRRERWQRRVERRKQRERILEEQRVIIQRLEAQMDEREKQMREMTEIKEGIIRELTDLGDH